jgi:Zn-dependent peptidase ImmA (M78 family)
MHCIDITSLEKKIINEADRLSKGMNVPIDVLGILERLQIRMRIDESKRDGAYLLADERGFEILIHGFGNDENMDRFKIAHELGHWILYHECNAMPMGVEEYWMHERLCDRFAARLLIPNWTLQEMMGEDEIAEMCGAPKLAIAIRMSMA